MDRPIADSADAKCAKLAIKTLGPSFNPSNYTFHGGTDHDFVLENHGTFYGQEGLDSFGSLLPPVDGP